MNEPGSKSAPPPPWRRKRWLIPGAIVVALVTTWIWVQVTYPYGISHCCSRGIALGLFQYATDHQGWFPHGGSSPEAALSETVRTGNNGLYEVRGKNISLGTAQAAWTRDGHLGPESCGWHYIEGLRKDDDPQMALAWDKAWGLGHNGQRVRGLGHIVILVGGEERAVALQEWPKYAMDLREKLDRIRQSRATNAPSIRWSDVESLGTNWVSTVK